MSTTGSGRAQQQLLSSQIEPFLQQLRDTGYAERTVCRQRTVAGTFARWAERKGIATRDLNGGHIDAFVGRSCSRRWSTRRLRTTQALRTFYLVW